MKKVRITGVVVIIPRVIPETRNLQTAVRHVLEFVLRTVLEVVMTIVLPVVKVHRVVHHVAANAREDAPAIVIPVVSINAHTNVERIVMVDVRDAIHNVPTVLVHVICRVLELVAAYVETVRKV